MNLDVSLLTETEQRVVRQVLNHFCAGDTPFADENTLPYFKQAYVASVLRRALKTLHLLNAAGYSVVGAALDKIDGEVSQT